MRLKRLELVGFKTFADATELVFDRGVTAVIGPNGSGKSNLADALLWVLAERRLSALRAAEGSDVIFAGADGRRSLSVAEVNLTIDNSDGTLPIDLTEVCVTRRLQDTAANLTRLTDLMLNLELQLEPLFEQKQVAERFQRLRTTANQLKLSLVVKDYDLAARRLARCDEELQGLATAIVAARTALGGAEAAESRARLDLQRVDEQAVVARQALGETAETLEQLQTKVRLGEERLTNLTSRIEEATAALARQSSRLGSLRGEAADDDGERAAAEARLTELRAELATVTGSLQDTAAADAEQAASELRRTVAQTADELAQLRSGIESAQARHGQAVRRLAETAARQSGSAARQAELQAAVTGADEAVAAAQAELERLRDSERAGRAALEAIDQRRTALRDEAADLQARIGELKAQLDVKRAAAASYEGFYAGVKAVCQARDRGRLRGDYAVVAEVLEVAGESHVALEAALGARLQDLVCETAEDARAAIEFLKQSRAGRATFLPLDSIDAGRTPPSSAALRKLPGVVGPALELVTTDPAYDAARRHLLSDVIVVEDLEAGLAVRRAGFERHTIVTLDGDLIRPRGSMSGGSRDTRAPNLLAKRRELESGEQELAARSAALAELRRGEAEQVELRRAAVDRGSAAQAALDAARQAQSDAERARLTARAAAAQASGESETLSRTARELSAERDEAAATAARLATALQAAEARRQALTDALSQAEREAAQHRAARAERSEVLTALRVEAARVEARLQGLGQRAARRATELAAARDEAARLERQRREWLVISDQTTAALRVDRAAWTSQRAAKEEQTAALTALHAMRHDASAGVEAAVKAARQAREDAGAASEAHHRAELRQAQADAELTHLRETLAEDHGGLTFEQAARQATDLTNRQEAAENIMLLSGGERAMCTITLLLAMFRVKPSPFCLLDELDAPLDEANIRKYVALLREFGQQSQFIVITHNPETTRAADILYGITMPAPGVSRAFSHRPPADEEAADEAFRAAD